MAIEMGARRTLGQALGTSMLSEPEIIGWNMFAHRILTSFYNITRQHLDYVHDQCTVGPSMFQVNFPFLETSPA